METALTKDGENAKKYTYNIVIKDVVNLKSLYNKVNGKHRQSYTLKNNADV